MFVLFIFFFSSLFFSFFSTRFYLLSAISEQILAMDRSQRVDLMRLLSSVLLHNRANQMTKSFLWNLQM